MLSTEPLPHGDLLLCRALAFEVEWARIADVLERTNDWGEVGEVYHAATGEPVPLIDAVVVGNVSIDNPRAERMDERFVGFLEDVMSVQRLAEWTEARADRRRERLGTDSRTPVLLSW